MPRWPRRASPELRASQKYLPAAAYALDPPADQLGDESVGGARVAPERTGVEHVDAGDGRAGDVAGQPRADDLDLGELGH